MCMYVSVHVHGSTYIRPGRCLDLGKRGGAEIREILSLVITEGISHDDMKAGAVKYLLSCVSVHELDNSSIKTR